MSGVERVVRAFGAVGWMLAAWEVAVTTPEGLIAAMGTLACLFVSGLLLFYALTGRSPFRRGD